MSKFIDFKASKDMPMRSWVFTLTVFKFMLRIRCWPFRVGPSVNMWKWNEFYIDIACFTFYIGPHHRIPT